MRGSGAAMAPSSAPARTRLDRLLLEAKFWLDPTIALAKSFGLDERALGRIERLIADREQEIRDAWNSHFNR